MEHSYSMTGDGLEVDLSGRLTFDERTTCRQLITELTSDDATNKVTRHFPSNLQTRHEYIKSHHFLKVYLLQSHYTSNFGNLTLF